MRQVVIFVIAYLCSGVVWCGTIFFAKIKFSFLILQNYLDFLLPSQNINTGS